MFATRGADGKLTLAVDAPIAPIAREELEASVAATTALYTSYIEAAIRKHPDQWNWLGLPRRGAKLSRADIARMRKAKRAKRSQGENPTESARSETSSVG
jgi:hypothetical protein